MLPDFPKTKKVISRFLLSHARAYERRVSPMTADVQTHRVFEGDGLSIKRPGEDDDVSTMETAEHEIALSEQELEEASLLLAMRKMEEVQDELLRKKSEMMIRIVSETTAKTGNVIDAGGAPLSHDLIASIFEKIQIDFDSEGQPVLPRMVVHPDQVPKLEEMNKEFEASPELKRAREEQIMKKRQEWRDREARRRLVG